jgi:hypothetical protein
LGVDPGQSAVSVSRKRLLLQDFLLEWPCTPCAASLQAQVQPALGFYEVTLDSYELEPEMDEGLKKIPPHFPLGNLDAVDQWSAGYL